MKSSVLKRIPFEIPDNVQGCDVLQQPMANQLEKLGPTAIKVKRSRSASAVFMKIPIELQQGYVKISYRYEDEEDIIDACYCHLLYRDIAFGRPAVDNAVEYSIYTYKTPEKQGAELVFDLFVKRPGIYFLSFQRSGYSASGSNVNLQTIFYDIKITQFQTVKYSLCRTMKEEAISFRNGSNTLRGVTVSYNDGLVTMTGTATASSYASLINLHNADATRPFPSELRYRKIKIETKGDFIPYIDLLGTGSDGQASYTAFTTTKVNLQKLLCRV